MADDRESRAAWVRENLPGCTALADAFRAEFGDVRLVFAAEGGHVIGKESGLFGTGVNGRDFALRKPCDGCKHLTVRLMSPEGKRLQQVCGLYRVAAGRCADWVAK